VQLPGARVSEEPVPRRGPHSGDAAQAAVGTGESDGPYQPREAGEQIALSTGCDCASVNRIDDDGIVPLSPSNPAT
jgi:hypothetical protein